MAATRALRAASGAGLLLLRGRPGAGLAVRSARHLWASSIRYDDKTPPPSAPGGMAGEEDAPSPRYTDQGGAESEDFQSEEELQHRILCAAIPFVPRYGWSSQAIAEGAKALELSAAAAGMFQDGGSELVLHFVSQCNARLAQLLEEENKLVQLGQAEKKPTPQFLRDAVEARLRMVIPYIGQWPQAMAILLLPQNIPSSLKLLSAMLDDVWHYAGDQSTDVSWYTRRAVLAGIYNTTELVMMQDNSPDYEETWNFLHNRISDAVTAGNSFRQATSTGEAVVQGLMGAAVTLKNLTGLNQRR